MNSLFDALLNRPIAEVIVALLLFILFSLHFLFVLFLIGTALQSVFYFIRYRGRADRQPEGDQPPVQSDGLLANGQPMPTSEALPAAVVEPQEKEYAWGKQILHSFLGIKSLAVALGVGALILVELGLTVPFFTAIHLFAPFWLLIIVLLITAFLSLDLIGQNWDIHPRLHLGMGMLGLLALLIVPGIFVAVMITLEHPEYWQAIINNNYKLPQALSLHWLVRYGHVLGAALVFGGAFHYFFSKADQRQKRSEMLRWVTSGFLVQFVLGILLYLSLPRRPDLLINLLIVIAILSAVFLLWSAAFRKSLPLRSTAPLLMLVLLPMLLTRQSLQNQGVSQANAQLEQNAASYRNVLASYSQQGLQAYQADLATNYANGEAIYTRSCSFCHGVQANGQGPESGNLAVPPEVLVAVRADRSYLDRVLRTGVPGSGMPYFTFMNSYQVNQLFAYLNGQYQILGMAQPPTGKMTQTALQNASLLFTDTCATCHGTDGRGGTVYSKGFAPPPPDLTRYSLTAQRTHDVITNGYAGTVMASYNFLPEDIRWGLVQVVISLRK